MDEKTEAPTPRRLAEIRRRGQTALSRELTMALGLLVGVLTLRAQGPAIVMQLGEMMRWTFIHLDRFELTPVALRDQAIALALAVMGMLAPLVLTLMGVGVGVTLVQTRGLVSAYLLQPNLARINPLPVVKGWFSTRGLVEVLKSLGKLTVVGIVTFRPLPDQLIQVTAAATRGMEAGLAALASLGMEICVRSAYLFVLIGAIDYVIQWRRFRQSTRMTKQEVREEMKGSEAPPMVRSRMRQTMRRWARQRMMQELPKADVVVTNPTHLAIALKYDAAKMAAPVVVAKGKGYVAAQIVNLARRHRVPVVENRPLAHLLIKLEIGAMIPPALYQAVAELLAFVYRLRRTRPAYV